jgi:transposase
MPPPLDPSSLDPAQKEALIVSLMAQVEALTKRVEEFEARLKGPPKTPDDSSLPPSRGQKASAGAGKSKPRTKPHEGAARALHPAPTRTVTRRADVCPHCAADVGGAEQAAVPAYDRIELPAVLLEVTRVVLLGGRARAA